MTRDEIRGRIDRVDEELVKLFGERMALAAEIAALKKVQGLPVLDPKREREKIAAVIEQTPEEYREYTPLLWSMIFELSRSYQNKLIGASTPLTEKINAAVENTPRLFPERASVACQGLEGSNAQLACDKLFRNPNILYLSSFDAVFSAIEKGLCRYGVIPVENSTAGSVNAVYDRMMHHNFYVVRSVRMKIDHNLLVKPGTRREDIREIYSHEQALNQCSDFLSTFPNARIIPCENTAVAARTVAQSESGDKAAIASRACVAVYGLTCLQSSVQNSEDNYTRFICIGKELEIFPGANRTSVMLVLRHEPGSLYKILARLYALDINLIKLESRPLPGRPFEFMFYFDLETPVYSPRLIQWIGEMPDACEFFQYLGSYAEEV